MDARGNEERTRLVPSVSLAEALKLPCPEHGIDLPYSSYAVLYSLGDDIEEWTCQLCGRRWLDDPASNS